MWEIHVFYFIERANSRVWSLHSLCIHSEEPGLYFVFHSLRSYDAFYIFYFFEAQMTLEDKVALDRLEH